MSDLTPSPLVPSLPNPAVAIAAERQAEAIVASTLGAAGGEAKPPNAGPAPGAAPASASEPASGPTSETGAGPAQEAAKPEPPKAERDPILDLVDTMSRAAAMLGSGNAGLVAGIQRLADQAAEPGRSSQALFRTQLAYAVQDMEKLVGSGQIRMPDELRTEMARLAATSPGLENGRMRALIGGTPELSDRGLVRDLRRAGTILGTMGADQHSPATMELVEALENRVRLSARAAPPRVEPGAQADPPTQTVQAAQPTGDPVATPADVPRSPQASNASDPATQSTKMNGSPDPSEQTRSAASPGDNYKEFPGQQAPRGERADVSDQPQQKTDQRAGAQPKTMMANIMDGMRTARSTAAAPWAPPPIAMAERIASFERALGQGKTDQLIRSTEASGVAYMEAIETFSKGPGAAILRKIEDAASTEPGGMRAVMSEMQVGGRYASCAASSTPPCSRTASSPPPTSSSRAPGSSSARNASRWPATSRPRRSTPAPSTPASSKPTRRSARRRPKSPAAPPACPPWRNSARRSRRSLARPPSGSRPCSAATPTPPRAPARGRAHRLDDRNRNLICDHSHRRIAPSRDLNPHEVTMRRFPLFLLTLLLIGAAVSAAHAQGAGQNGYQTDWAALDPGDDWSAQVLRSLFPVTTGTALQGIGAENTVIGAMLGQLTGFLLALAAVFIGYMTIIHIHRAAESGRVLSNSVSSWAPVRLVLAIALMFPLPSGFSSGQWAVMKVSLWGIGMARSVYTAAIKAVGPDAMPIAQPMIPGTKSIVAGLIQNELCRALINQASGNANLVPIPAGIRSFVGGAAAASGAFVNWPYTLSDGNAIDAPTCGSVTIRQPNPNATNYAGVSVDMAGAQLTALTNVLSTDIRPDVEAVAAQFWQTRKASALSPLLGTMIRATQDYTQQLTQTATTFTASLRAALANADAARAGALGLAQNQDRLAALGWTGAGAYYVEIARLNGQTLSLLSAVPTVQAPSYRGFGWSLGSDMAPLVSSALAFQQKIKEYVDTTDGLDAPGGNSELFSGATPGEAGAGAIDQVVRSLHLNERVLNAIVGTMSTTTGSGWTDPFAALINLGQMLILISLSALGLAAVLASTTATAGVMAWNVLTLNFSGAAAAVGGHLIMSFLGTPIFYRADGAAHPRPADRLRAADDSVRDVDRRRGRLAHPGH